ncbi:hypothetical protein EDD21DRAFT_360197 [Dissophora ornata]|nr:hypothetical protein EDD21DRAFT_360197 [Dissophora ornata]
MDNLVLHVQNEVALDGESGCSWDRFWFIVDEFLQRKESTAGGTASPPKSFQGMKRTDEKFRQFFWNNFVQEDGVLFYKHSPASGEASAPTSSDQDHATSNHSRASYVPFSELVALAPSEISYQKVTGNYKDVIRIVASEELQRMGLLGYSGAATQISKQGFQVLQSITAAREFGATQAQLAKLHKIDPRSMFHFLKILIAMKLIVKIPVTTDGQYTLLCLHTKFASMNPGYKAMNSDDSFSSAGRMLITSDGGRRFEGLLKSDTKKVSYYSGLIKQKLTDILGRSKNQIMMIEDLAKALDLTDMNVVQNRWFNRQIELLCKLKYIKRVHAPGVYRCVQLLRPYGASVPADEMEAAQLNLKNVIADDAPLSGICIDTSIEHQVFRNIVDSKEQGTIAKEIRQKMNMLNVKLLSRILDTLCKPLPGSEKPLVNRVVEFVGRERRYRYYSEHGFKASVAEDHKDYIEKAKISTGSAAPKRAARKSRAKQAPTSSDTQAVLTPGNLGITLDHATVTASLIMTAPSPEASGSSSQPADGVDAATSSLTEPANAATLVTDTTTTDAIAPATPRMPELTQAATPERFISVALLKRRKVILSILERKRMLEIHSSLVTEYQLEKARLFPDQEENSVIDRKTLFRTINILEAEGLLKVFKVQNIPMVGGGTVTKSFCLHPTVEVESQEVRKFVKECSNRHLLFGSLANRPMRRAEKVELEVESLDEMQQRLGQDFYKAPSIPLADVDAVNPKLKDESGHKPKRGYDLDGLSYAMEYGWNKAKMMRALAFHRLLLDKLASADRTLFCFPSKPNILSTSCLFDVMSLRVFLIVIGIVQDPSEESRAYLETHRNSTTPLNSLPSHMRMFVTPNYNFKKRLREVLEILDALGLVSPLAKAPETTDSESRELEYAINHLVLNMQYEVHVNVRAPLHPLMPERIDENLTDRKEYMLLSATECREFWLDLQASASTMKYFPKDKSSGRPWSDIRRDFLLNLCNKTIWAEPIRITTSQREKLMRLVNKKVRYIPPFNDPKIEDVAQETGLPVSHVLQFYKAVRAAWHAHPITKRSTRLRHVRKGRQALGEEQEENTRKSIKAPSTGMETKNPAPQADTANVGHQTVIANIHGRFGAGKPKQTRAKRILWSDADDERLLLGYAVTRCIADSYNVKFSWHSVAHGFSGKRSREICRHRFDKLMRETTLSKRVDGYRAQFSGVMKEISEKFEIDRNLKNFDPSPVLAYFRPDADTPIGEVMDSSPLFRNVKDIERLNVVRHTEPHSSLYIEQRLHPELSLPRRLQLMNMMPPTIRSIDQELDDAPENLEKPRVISGGDIGVGALTVRDETLGIEHIILTLVKAVYCLPRQKRPRSVIRSILEGFDSSKVFSTCELAKEWKILTSIRNSSYRIPGQKVGRSERFSALLNGAYPRRLTLAASSMDEIYDKAEARLFPLDAGPAEIMAFLTDVSMGWLQLSMAKSNGAGYATAFEEPYGQGAVLHFDVEMKNTRALAAPVPIPASSRTFAFKGIGVKEEESGRIEDDVKTADPVDEQELHIEPQPSETTDEAEDLWQKARDNADLDLEKLLETIPIMDCHHLYRSIYNITLRSGTSGMVPQDIKDALHKQSISCTDKEIMDCVRTLQHASPEILVKVGMAHTRFVVFGWHQTWTVNYRAAVERVLTDSAKKNAQEHGRADDPRYWIVPRMWNSLEGVVDRSIYETCLHSVLSHIAEKPGMSKGALLRHFHKMFLPVEMDELIEELERRDAIEAQFGILPKATMLFAKRGVYRRCERDTIDERKVTNLFPRPAYYSYVDMSLVIAGTNVADVPLAEGELEAEGEEGEVEGEVRGEAEGESDEGGDEDELQKEQPVSKKLRTE